MNKHTNYQSKTKHTNKQKTGKQNSNQKQGDLTTWLTFEIHVSEMLTLLYQEPLVSLNQVEHNTTKVHKVDREETTIMFAFKTDKKTGNLFSHQKLEVFLLIEHCTAYLLH